MKIAIVNRLNLLNFGSVLQVLALSEAIKKCGYDTDILWEKGSLVANYDFRPKKLLVIILKLIMHPKLLKNTIKEVLEVKQKDFSESTKNAFSSFIGRYFSYKYYSFSDLKKIAKTKEYRYFVCGSDQVWCSTTLYPDPLMYLRFVPQKKRVAYAPSLGRNYIPNYNRYILRKYINGFDRISVREIEGARLIKQLTARDVPVLLDPTLLFDFSFWKNFANSIKERNFILCYFLDTPSDKVIKQIALCAKGNMVVALRSRLKYLEEDGINVIYPDCGPAEFLSYIAYADFIFTDSYHGMLFSVNFQKEFYSVARNYSVYDQSSRQKSILDELGIENRYGDNACIPDELINYQIVNMELNKLRKKSFNYLINSFKVEM